jgi:hypothetical protein
MNSSCAGLDELLAAAHDAKEEKACTSILADMRIIVYVVDEGYEGCVRQH